MNEKNVYRFVKGVHTYNLVRNFPVPCSCDLPSSVLYSISCRARGREEWYDGRKRKGARWTATTLGRCRPEDNVVLFSHRLLDWLTDGDYTLTSRDAI